MSVSLLQGFFAQESLESRGLELGQRIHPRHPTFKLPHRRSRLCASIFLTLRDGELGNLRIDCCDQTENAWVEICGGGGGDQDMSGQSTRTIVLIENDALP